MEGKTNLNSLPDSFKGEITARYGSLDRFYDMVYCYVACVIEKNAVKKKVLEDFRYGIILELDKMADKAGLNIDCPDIYDEISEDFDEQRITINYAGQPPENNSLNS